MAKRKLSEEHERGMPPLARFNTRLFRVQHTSRYQGSFPVYKQPTELTSYSIDHERRVWFDDRELKYYYPATGKDLTVGFDKFIERDETVPEHLDTLLDALTDAKAKPNAHPDATKADIVTWRGIMTKLLCTPYARREAWDLRLTRYNDTIYIEESTATKLEKQQEPKSVRQQMMCYWGYRFETLSTVSTPPSELAKDDPELTSRLHDSANTNIQYCVLVKTKLGSSSLIMGAEVDCIRDKKPEKDPLRHYLELKTSRVVENDRQQRSFERYKLLKFWAQSFLVGVPKIVVGFRDDGGQLASLEEIPTMSIPGRVRGKEHAWDPSVCLNFADQVLAWLRSQIKDNDKATTYALRWQEPFNELILECIGDRDVFLTKRFIDGHVSHDIGGERCA